MEKERGKQKLIFIDRLKKNELSAQKYSIIQTLFQGIKIVLKHYKKYGGEGGNSDNIINIFVDPFPKGIVMIALYSIYIYKYSLSLLGLTQYIFYEQIV